LDVAAAAVALVETICRQAAAKICPAPLCGRRSAT